MTLASAVAAPAVSAPRSLPRPLAGFEHVKRHWDPVLGCASAKILPGEYYATAHDEMVSTVLGSCVAACVWDSDAGVGGMNHFLLPEPMGDSGSWAHQAGRAARYGADAMEQLLNAVLKAGGQRRRLRVKIFGGGQILANMTDIGRRNIDFVRRYLSTEGLELLAADVGDVYPRHVRFFPSTGKAQVRRLRSAQDAALVDRERNYLKRLVDQPISGAVELF